MESYLPVIWAAIIGCTVAMYVILDGFDLGIGILFPFAASEEERDQMMRSVAPFWDGNETWLVLGGGGLLVAFPVANGQFAGGPFDWATPFAVACGLGVIAGYALLGATWLGMKTEGALAER